MPKTKSAKRRPRELTKRYQIRCLPQELEVWERAARALGFGGASAWIRRVANDAAAARSKPSETAGSLP